MPANILKEYRLILTTAFQVLLVCGLGGCTVDHATSPTTLTQTGANAIAVTPTPLKRARLYARFHDLPHPALLGQARVLKLAFADSDLLIDVPETVQTALRDHWVALENYHRAKDEGLNVAQATFDHTIAAVNLRNILRSVLIETRVGTTHLDESESDAIIDMQVELFVEARNNLRRN